MKKPKVLIVGLVGFNLGDEAIAIRAAEALSERYRVTIVSLNKGVVIHYGYSEFYFKPKSIFSWLKLLFEAGISRKVLIGGGSLIQDKMGGGWGRGVIGYLNLVTMLLRLINKKIISIPLGVDDISDGNVRLAENIIARFESFVVRDELSRENVIRYSRGKIIPRVIPDPVFGFPGAAYSKVEAERGKYDNFFDSRYICLALAKENVLDEEGRLVAQLVECVLEWIKGGHNVLLVCMDSRETDELALYRYIECEVLRAYGETTVRELLIYRPVDIFDAACCLRGADAVVAMRLHALILAYSYSDIFCVSRTTKTKAICDELNIPNLDLEVSSNLSEEALVDLKALNFSSDLKVQRERLILKLKAVDAYLSKI